jgi:PAS domain S-box-containing protein
MNNSEFQLRGIDDPRLAVHATKALPAWLWAVDGTKILWSNPVGARLFGAANSAVLAQRAIGPADAQRRQVAQLAGRLPDNGAVRLERLRGFGATPGMLATCGCARLAFADGSNGILITATQAAGRKTALIDRLQHVVDAIDLPTAAFSRDGLMVAASDAARQRPCFHNLVEAGLGSARNEALTDGRAETRLGIADVVVYRIGSGEDMALIALISDAAAADIEQRAEPASPETCVSDPPQAPLAPISDRVKPVGENPAVPTEAPAAFPEANTRLDPLAQAAAMDVDPVGAVVSNAGIPEDPLTTTGRKLVGNGRAADHEAVGDAPGPAPGAAPEAESGVVAQAIPEIATKGGSWRDKQVPNARRHPLRFMWQMDADGRFLLGSDEFVRLIGARTAASFGRPWSEIAEEFDLDPDHRVLNAIATHDTWSGIIVNWPVDGGFRLPVELSGLPSFDRTRKFAGYRGFGVCRDLNSLTRLAALRRFESFGSPAASPAAETDHLTETPPETDRTPAAPVSPAASPSDGAAVALPEPPAPSQLRPIETRPQDMEQTDLETQVEPARNVLPFRPLGETKPPVLTAVENNAFNELARQLSARLQSDRATTPLAAPETAAPSGLMSGSVTTSSLTPSSPTPSSLMPSSPAPNTPLDQPIVPQPEPACPAPDWLLQPQPAPRGETGRDKTVLDLLPVGVLIYRLDRLLYANPAFLSRLGYGSLNALEQAGGLDALYVEPGVSIASSTSETGTPVTIVNLGAAETSSPAPAGAHLHTISWDGESALALIFSGTALDDAAVVAMPAKSIEAEPPAAGRADAEELAAILDTTAEGIVIFDADGNIKSCNRSAEALFGYDSHEIMQHGLAELFAPESQPVVRDYLRSIKGGDMASLLEHGRDLLGRVREGGLIPLSLTMGRTRPEGPHFFAVFRDLSQSQKTESEFRQMQRVAERTATAKADLLARISHEVRTPLNAIIGFSEVMIGERFGTLGNDRYVEYMKDIRASGERVIAVISDLLDLTRIETGKLELAFSNHHLNDLIEQCVAVMQPQANRERIIIRTSLAHLLPPVVADGRALRQIALNLISNSIQLANTGGQVIVSTALSDFGEVVLRVRDTGHGLNAKEVAAAMEPFRTQAPSDHASAGSAVNLSLTKALVEANRAQFHVKSAPNSGTLIEVVFSHAMAKA